MTSATGSPGRGPLPPLLARLLEEHRSLLPSLQQWVESLPQTPPDEARARLAALAARLRQHARVEDETLFAAMADRLGQAALTGYLMQHDDIDDVLTQLLSVAGGLPADARELADRLLWYCESHFEIEEQHIFQEAQALLTPEQWDALDRQARALEAELGPAPEPAA